MRMGNQMHHKRAAVLVLLNQMNLQSQRVARQQVTQQKRQVHTTRRDTNILIGTTTTSRSLLANGEEIK